ncbi:alpha/beta hydrolase family protein [Nocardioides hwasunensis]|uniref:S9 family peptidase n=1 Tax=Nocardioides hwasunensis TaxID=397258 RepID=A0ABR8MQH8_9ACTN|nr:prolyl oligopeptidase family serine peptidase [Nocardioides hwasunensis]MBD3916339.1 S9 family peptidase [Nocardioides hwasunensis]
MPDPQLTRWFPSGAVLTARAASGPAGLCLVVEDGPEHGIGRVLDLRTLELGPVLPFAVGFDSLLSPDGSWVVGLDDDGGSEVGGLVARSVDGTEVRPLTDRAPFVLRGLEYAAAGAHLLATIVDEDGHHLLHVPVADPSAASVLFSSPEESWFGHLSADGTLACADTTDHVPGVRRPAVSVVDVTTRRVVAVADDLPDGGPVRAVRFSATPGDPRILLATERSGFARPALWDPMSGERRDYELPELEADAIVLDWHAETGTILVVDALPGRHRLLAVDEHSGAVRVLRDEGGSVCEPDVASVFPHYAQSFLAPDGRVVVLASSWTTPLHVEVTDGAETRVVVPPVEVPAGIPLASQLVDSADGTPVQLWWAVPDGPPRGTILQIHGGPNLVTLDRFHPDVQAWLASGFAVGCLNYRGSVTFGRTFREGFWGVGGDREIEDVEAALDWLRGRGLADPASTFITGASYGGHMSLLSVGRLPDRFAGALAIVAMADWEAAWDEMNPALRKTWTSFMSLAPDGSFDSSRIDETLKRFSPINHVDRVRASVWLHQGSRDTRTPPSQARSYGDRLRAAGGDVLVEWFDAGHEPTGSEAARHECDRLLELVEARLVGTAWRDLDGLDG